MQLEPESKPAADIGADNIERIRNIATALVDARRSGTVVAEIAPQIAPRSITEAFAVQHEVARQLALSTVAWKVGLVPNVRLTYAPIYQPALHRSPAHIVAMSHSRPFVEAEVAFRLRRDLPPRPRPYTQDEVADTIESAHAAIEIVQPRLGNFMKAPVEHKIADGLGNLAVVWGAGQQAWERLDLTQLQAIVRINQKEVISVIGGNNAGNPLFALVALANVITKEVSLLAGDVIITGSCTGMTEVEPGVNVEVEFVGLGTAEVTIL